MAEHKYKVAYALKELGEGKTKAEMQADPELEGYGGTDKIVLVSIIEPEGGGESLKWSTMDGNGDPLPDKKMLQIMSRIARNIALRGEVGEGASAFCWAVWNTHLQAMGVPEQDLEQARERFAPPGGRYGGH